MPEQIMFTEEEFAIMEEALTDLKKSADRAARAKVEVEVGDSSDPLRSTGGFGAFLGAHFKQMAQEAIASHAQKAEGITLLSAKLIQLKRFQRQQGVQSNTAAQA